MQDPKKVWKYLLKMVQMSGEFFYYTNCFAAIFYLSIFLRQIKSFSIADKNGMTPLARAIKAGKSRSRIIAGWIINLSLYYTLNFPLPFR